MKKLLLHIILFTYAIVMFKPAFPFLNDFVAHVLFYQQHMATVHLEEGKYHVHAEVNKELKNQSPQKNTDLQKKAFSQNDLFSVKSIEEISLIPLITTKNFFDGAPILLNNYLQDNFRPPKFSL